MQPVFTGPQWFSGVDHAFGILSLLTAIFVAYYSYRIYRFTDQHKYRLMALAFLLFGLSFGVKFLTDLGVRAQVTEMGGIQNLAQIVYISSTLQSGYFAMRFFMLLGLVLFLKLAFDIRNNRILVLLAFFSLMVTFSAHSTYYAYHIAAAVMLAFIIEFLIRNYFQKKTKAAGVVVAAFCLLLLGQLSFIFVTKSAKLYALGETLQLGGFVLFIVNHV